MRFPSLPPGIRAPLANRRELAVLCISAMANLNDIERKAELGGNIHAKGMMIMQASLMSELR